MTKKEYVKKDGTKSIYLYDSNKYNSKRNKTIYNLQKQKNYYKRIGNIEKMRVCQIKIDIEKRKMEG